MPHARVLFSIRLWCRVGTELCANDYLTKFDAYDTTFQSTCRLNDGGAYKTMRMW